MSTNRPSLADLLKAAVKKANQEQADAKQVERISALVKARLKLHASDDDDLVCPSCGYKAPESEFEPDGNGDSDGFRTDPVTGGTGNDDDQNEGHGAKVPAYDNRRMSA